LADVEQPTGLIEMEINSRGLGKRGEERRTETPRQKVFQTEQLGLAEEAGSGRGRHENRWTSAGS
jgi:hypothetical protein